MPAFAARLMFGEMADALLLSSTRVKPARLLASSYPFRHHELEPALHHLLRRS
jgi:NAD dependent epimerase/dehydratase family enzyme